MEAVLESLPAVGTPPACRPAGPGLVSSARTLNSGLEKENLFLLGQVQFGFNQHHLEFQGPF